MKHIRHPFGQEGGAALSGSCRMSFAEGTSQAMSLTFRAEPQASTELNNFRWNVAVEKGHGVTQVIKFPMLGESNNTNLW